MRDKENRESQSEVDKEDSTRVRKIAERITAAEQEGPAGYEKRADGYRFEDLYGVTRVRERTLKPVNALVGEHQQPDRHGEIQDAGIGNKCLGPRPGRRSENGGSLAELESDEKTNNSQRGVHRNYSRFDERHHKPRHTVLCSQLCDLRYDSGFGSHDYFFLSECSATCKLSGSDDPRNSPLSCDNAIADAIFFSSSKMKVLITSPSLDENENVSGISTMISNIIEHGGCEFVHFRAGRADGEKFDLHWVAKQLTLPFAFRRAVTKADPQLIHINTAFEPRGVIRDLILAKSVGKRPIVLHVHGGRFVMEDFPNKVLASLARKLLDAASRVILLGEPEAERILKFFPGLKTAILPNAVASKDFPEAERVWRTKSIVYLGRLQEAKGLSEMVEACRLLRGQGFKFKFSCFGTGPDRQEFIRRMTGVLGDDFHYGGVIAGAEKIRALNSADIFLMPSRYEGLSLALLEAMAAGCVPIVSNRGSMPTVVDDGRNGFLIDPGDITQIVGKLKFLLSEGETGWNQYRLNARETVRSRFDIAPYAEKLRNIYAETLAKK